MVGVPRVDARSWPFSAALRAPGARLTFELSEELRYILLVIGLFIVPRVLQRFRIPSAITCAALGALASMGFGAFGDDSTVKLLATFGIVAMFLFAGLEVDFRELKRGRSVLIQHVAAQLGLLGLGAVGASVVFGLSLRAALLFALAVFTPSTGFIMDTLDSLRLSPDERFWVKSKAIASELVALIVLFFAVQSADLTTLGISAASLLAMVVVLPPVLRFFARRIAPHAPNTEFTFLVIVALICAFLTHRLGVYYLVGAFVVGITAVRLRRDLPELSSEKLLGGVELFAAFFIPFYFFKAGLHLEPHQFVPRAFLLAAALLVVVLPLRIGRVALHRRLALGEPFRKGLRISVAVLPTLVFTIVIGGILQERFGLSDELFGALMLFTLVNTLIPSFVLHLPPPEFDTPEVPRDSDPNAGEGVAHQRNTGASPGPPREANDAATLPTEPRS